jgi:hypothetical protein
MGIGRRGRNKAQISSPAFLGPGALLANYQEPINKRLKAEISTCTDNNKSSQMEHQVEMCTSETCHNRLEVHRRSDERRGRRIGDR